MVSTNAVPIRDVVDSKQLPLDLSAIKMCISQIDADGVATGNSVTGMLHSTSAVPSLMPFVGV